MGVTATYPLLPGIPGTPTSKGGEIPLAPFAHDEFRVSIRRPPTKDEIFDILRRVTEPSYHVPIIDDPRGGVALYRQMACQMQTVADKGFRSQQSSFYLTYPTQGDLPASSLQSATMVVSIQRTKNRDVNLTAEIATIIMFGPHGRTYVNAERVVWAPFDASDLKPVEFISQNPGYAGNLNHIADANGLLTNPDGSAATDIVGLQPQGGTSNVFADIVANASGQSTMVDQGKPDTFSEADVGLYIEILTATNAENVGRLLQIVNFSQPGVEDPAGSGLFPRQILVNDGPVQTQIFVALSDDGTLSFNNETAAARSTTADDMNLMLTPGLNDGYYFGGVEQFSSIELTVSTPGVGVWEITWEYWDGGSYVPLSGVIDGTVGLTQGGTQTVSWTVPGNWQVDTLATITAFYVRAQVTDFTSSTTAPLGQIVYTNEINQLTPELDDEFVGATGAVEWVVRDWISLGLEVIQIEAPTGGRDNILRLLGEERGVFQQNGETDDSFRVRAASLADVVSPNAILNTVNRALAPFGFTGSVIDVATGGTFKTFNGLFWDIDAWDYNEVNVVSMAIADDGGAGTDETAAAQSDTPDDMTLLPATVAVPDRYFFGQTEPYSGLDLDITTPGIGDWVIEWRYFNGSISTPLADVVDNSDSFKNVGIRRISWTVPGDWATDNPFGFGAAFYVEARVISVTTTTQQPLGRQAKTRFEFPAEDDYKLFLSGRTGDPNDQQFGEAYGWFFVFLPCLPSTEDFGFAWDINEPANLLDGEILATAWDIGVFDGEPTDADAAYASLANQIDLIRAGGVGFTLIKDCRQNVPICA